MTDAEYAAWLALPSANRVVLVEVGVNAGGSETTRYLASKGYISAAADTPASTYYEARVADSVGMTEALGLGSEGASSSIADIGLNNVDGGLDGWLLDVFSNRSITVYFGDVSWPKSDFRAVYIGVVDSLGASDSRRFTLHMADKMGRLESAVTETKLGGSTPNADALIPLCFGECHNVTPLLTNPGTLEYAVHNGPIESIIEVRDNGIPVTFTPVLSTGRFTLARSPIGAVTASVQGDKPAGVYSNTVAALVQRLVTGFGRADQRFTSGDIDAANLSSFEAANAQPVGVYVADFVTVRQVCDQLAAAVGAKMVLSRTGLLRLLKIALPSTPVITVDADTDASSDSGVVISRRLGVAAACKLAYCRNWTVQELQTGLPTQHRDLFATEWLTSTASDTTAANLYKISGDVAEEESLLLRKVDADAEALRRLNLRKVQRNVYRVEGFASLVQCELGQGITLKASRYGLQSGVNGLLVSLQVDWQKASVSAEVLA